MKRITPLLTLTLGLSAFTALAQSQGDQAKHLKDPPARRDDAQPDRDERRDDEARPDRSQRRDQAGPRQMERGDSNGPRHGFGPQPPFAPGRRGFGPQQGFGPGRQAFGPQGRGQARNRPQAGSQQRDLRPEVCPHCKRPFDPGAAQGPQFRDRQGFGPRPEAGPRQRGFGPQARGQAFGPPPWVGRGGPDGDMRPGQRGPQGDAPMPERGMGPVRRGLGGPGGGEGRFERPQQGPPREGPPPLDRQPVEPDGR